MLFPLIGKSKLSISNISFSWSFIGWENGIILRVIDIDDIPLNRSLKTIFKINREVLQLFEMDFIEFFERRVGCGFKEMVLLFSEQLNRPNDFLLSFRFFWVDWL